MVSMAIVSGASVDSDGLLVVSLWMIRCAHGDTAPHGIQTSASYCMLQLVQYVICVRLVKPVGKL